MGWKKPTSSESVSPVVRCLAKRPEDRYPSASELGERLLAFLKQAQDHRGQREMGLFVSGIYPDDPNIPSDILKSLAAVSEDSAASGGISHASVLSATFSSVVGGSSGSSGAGQPSAQGSQPSGLSSNLDVAFVPSSKEKSSSKYDAFEVSAEEDTNATTRGGDDEEDEGGEKITGFEEWSVARKDGRMQLVSKTEPQPGRGAVDEKTPTRTYEPHRGRKKAEDEDLKTDPSDGGAVQRESVSTASPETLVGDGDRSDTADSLEAVAAPAKKASVKPKKAVKAKLVMISQVRLRARTKIHHSRIRSDLARRASEALRRMAKRLRRRRRRAKRAQRCAHAGD